MWGRTDHVRYPCGARTLKNFIVTKHGVAVNRPGTQHLGVLETAALLHPFIFDETDNYMLVFTDGHMRIYAPGTNPRYPNEMSIVVGMNTPYSDDDFSNMKFSQEGNIITITCTGMAAYELERTTGSSFTLTELSFDIPDFVNATGFLYPPVIDHRFNDFEGDTSHPARVWTWGVTRILRDSDGNLYETAMYEVIYYQDSDESLTPVLTEIAVYPDYEQQILLYAEDGDVASSGDNIVASRIYRGREGRFGFVGETKSDRFIDDGSTPDFSNPPPQGFNPFKIYSGTSLVRTEYPNVASFFSGRRILAGTEQRGSLVLGSSLESITNFDEVDLPDDADSFSIKLLGASAQNIRSIVPRENLFAFTSGGVWLVGGAGVNEPITPNSVYARQIVEGGCATLQPISSNQAIFYVESKGAAPHALLISDRGSYEADDISLFARHLFDGYTIVSWAYAKDPYSVLWVVRSDGALLSLTYLRSEDMLAWTRHEISDDGLVERVATKPEGSEDAVYLVVNRDGVRTFERMAYRLLTDVRDSNFLDRSVSYENQGTHTLSFEDFYGNGGDIGENSRVTLGGGTLLVGQVIQIDDPDDGDPFKFIVTSDVGLGVYEVQTLTRDAEDWLWEETIEAGEWYICFTSVSGLGHLEGETVTALLDGNVVEGLVVTGGSVDLGAENYVAVAHVGLSYDSDFESLDAINGKGKQKNVKAVTLELEGSRGGYVGSSLETLIEARFREVSDSYLTMGLKRLEARVNVPDKWRTSGSVAFRQSSPLPVTILGISREVEYGGD